MNRAERRFEMKCNKTNSKSEGEKNMRGMNRVNEMRNAKIRGNYEKLTRVFDLKCDAELTDKLVTAKYEEVTAAGDINDFILCLILDDDFVKTETDRIHKLLNEFGLSGLYSTSELKDTAFLGASLFVAIAVTIMQERYGELWIHELLSDLTKYELSDLAEEKLKLIVSIIFPAEQVQAINTFNAMLTGDAQSFVNELDKFEAMLGIQR